MRLPCVETAVLLLKGRVVTIMVEDLPEQVGERVGVQREEVWIECRGRMINGTTLAREQWRRRVWEWYKTLGVHRNYAARYHTLGDLDIGDVEFVAARTGS